MDRIDLHVEVPALKLAEYKGKGGETSEAVARRVLEARKLQCDRLSSEPGPSINAAMTTRLVRSVVQLQPAAQELLDSAFDRLGLSARAATRVLKVAQTIADVAADQRVGPAHIAEAIQYRSLLDRS